MRIRTSLRLVLAGMTITLSLASCGGGDSDKAAGGAVVATTPGSSTPPDSSTASGGSTTPDSSTIPGGSTTPDTSIATGISTNASNSDAAPTSAAELLRILPHDESAFTQGLVLHNNGALYESTGGYGSSTVRRRSIENDDVTQRISIPAQYFGEGITILGDRLYQLTLWENTGFVYDLTTLQQSGTFSYEGEGWGLTTDGNGLILSNGTNVLRYLDPQTFQVLRTIEVTDAGRPVGELNELEWVRGEIWANVWHSLKIARIDPQSGQVRGWLDLSDLAPPVSVQNSDAALNGIAFDNAGGTVFVTGKLWPVMYQIRLP